MTAPAMQDVAAKVSGHATIYLSVIYGVAVATMMTGAGRLLRNHGRLSRPGLTILWTVIYYWQISQAWWSIGTWGPFAARNFLNYLTLTLPAAIFCLLPAVLYPSRIPERGLDLREHFLAVRLPFFASAIALQACGIGLQFLNHTAVDVPAVLVVRGTAIALLALLAWRRAVWLHYAVAALLLAMAVAWALLFTWTAPRMPG